MDNNNILSHTHDVVSNLRDILLFSTRTSAVYKNPLNAFGRKVFSQSDEDGIIFEIVRRINSKSRELKCFFEFGCGDGSENNTLALAAQKWKGVWLDSRKPDLSVKQGQNFLWITKQINTSNITTTYKQCCAYIQNEADFISFDFDGNDFYLIKTLLEDRVRAKFWCVEYNGKFGPNIEWVKPYEENCSWSFDDYFGASLASYVNLFQKHNYMLVCCNGFTGTNAFFVDYTFADAFKDVPSSIDDIWVEPRYYLPQRYGHPTSLKTVKSIIDCLNE